MQVLSEHYVNVTRKLRPGLSPDDAWEDVTALLARKPQPVDDALLRGGREIERRYRLGWWDSLALAAARQQECTILLSEDYQDGADYGGVAVRSPFTLSAGEAVAAYQALPALNTRVPARGRPRNAQRVRASG